LAVLEVWPIETYSPYFVNCGPGSRDTMQRHASVLHWYTCKWFFDNFPMYADSSRVLSIHWRALPRIRYKLCVHVTCRLHRAVVPCDSTAFLLFFVIAFSALTLLAVHQEEYPGKNE